MNAKQLIPAFSKRKKPKTTNILNVSEFYYDTIQGEGINIGVPAAFLRLQKCFLGCTFCDTTEVWRHGNAYTYGELIKMMEDAGLKEKLLCGQYHLVITGGSPLLQQKHLIQFFVRFIDYFGFLPYIEIENECIIKPHDELLQFISCWNNSPKLTNSGVEIRRRYIPTVIEFMSSLPNSWFKFVISSPEDWEEIDVGYIFPGFIKKDQVILMPEGATEEEIRVRREMVIEMAVENGVRYSTREHIVTWGRKTGI